MMQSLRKWAFLACICWSAGILIILLLSFIFLPEGVHIEDRVFSLLQIRVEALITFNQTDSIVIVTLIWVLFPMSLGGLSLWLMMKVSEEFVENPKGVITIGGIIMFTLTMALMIYSHM